MSERKVLRMLKHYLLPERACDMQIAFGKNGSWAVRVSFKGGHDRWFKGEGVAWHEEKWFPGEDQHRQYARP